MSDFWQSPPPDEDPDRDEDSNIVDQAASNEFNPDESQGFISTTSGEEGAIGADAPSFESAQPSIVVADDEAKSPSNDGPSLQPERSADSDSTRQRDWQVYVDVDQPVQRIEP